MQQEMRKSKLKKVTNLDQKHSGKSIKSDNLHVPLTPSTFHKIKTSASRPSTAKSSRSRIDPRKSVKEREPAAAAAAASGLVRLSHSSPSEVPGNLAVHFTSFYQNQDLMESLPHSIEEKGMGHQKAVLKTSRNFPKMEFTRQMVYTLENSAGTHHYGKQVSAVLENTVESPGFNLKLPPLDNCSPSNKSNDYYPLWYRDPNKIPQISGERFQEMKNKYQYKIDENKKPGKGVRKLEEESISDSSETEVEFETETDSEEDETLSTNYCKDSNGRSSVNANDIELSIKSSESITSIENNYNLDNSVVNDINAESVLSSSMNWSSRNSCKTIESENDDEESIDWETEVEEEEECQIEVKVVNNFRKITVLNQV